MAQQQAIRDYLRSKGLKDDEITYDNGTVLAKGQRFLDAKPQSDGRTYADTRSLDQAYGRYDTNNQMQQLRTQATQPNAEMAAMRQQLQQRINQQPKAFEYDVKNSAEYKAALNRAQANAKTAGNNAMVQMGARGIGNSSITSDRVAQIGQQAVSALEDTVVPQLTAQAYQQYLGQLQQENQQTQNLYNLYNTMSNEDQQRFGNLSSLLGQQYRMTQDDIANQRADTQEGRQRKLDNMAAAQWYSQQYGVPIEAKEDWSLLEEQVKGLKPLSYQQYLAGREDAKFAKDQTLWERDFRTGEAAADRQYRQAQLGLSGRSADLQEQRFRYETDPYNIDNQYKSAQLEQLTTPKAETFETYTKFIDSNVAKYDEDGNLLNPDAVESSILSSDLSDYDMYRLYKAKGLKWEGPAPEKK